VRRIRYKTSDRRDSQSHSSGSAWVRPPAQPWSGWGARADVSMRATDMGLWDVVAVLQVSPGVKRKTRNGSRGWRGEAEHLGCGDGHRSGGQLLDSARAPKVSSRAAKAVKLLIFSMPARLT
jgi:hypothetical protein